MTAPKRKDVDLPCEPIGLSRLESAAYVGVSAPTFDLMVQRREMPQPKMVGSRRIWDREALKAAFKALPEKRKGSSWDEDPLEARTH